MSSLVVTINKTKETNITFDIEETIKTTRPHLKDLLINRHAYAVLETVKHENTFFVFTKTRIHENTKRKH